MALESMFADLSPDAMQLQMVSTASVLEASATKLRLILCRFRFCWRRHHREGHREERQCWKLQKMATLPMQRMGMFPICAKRETTPFLCMGLDGKCLYQCLVRKYVTTEAPK